MWIYCIVLNSCLADEFQNRGNRKKRKEINVFAVLVHSLEVDHTEMCMQLY